MTDANESPKSQTELIVEKFIENLGIHSEFDGETLSKLKELASSGNLTKPEMVAGAINAQSGGKSEDS